MKTNYILNSIKKELKNIQNIYVYSDSKIDVSKVVKCNSKVNLPLGTETTFILQNNDYNIDYINSDLKYWYIRFTDNGEDKYRIITDYNALTGQITISSGFGIPLASLDTFDVLCLDSIFIYTVPVGESTGSRKSFTREYQRIYMIVQTKEDSSRYKINVFMDSIKDTFYLDFKHIDVFNESSIKVGNCKINGTLSFSEKTNADNNLQAYIGTFMVDYVIKY